MNFFWLKVLHRTPLRCLGTGAPERVFVSASPAELPPSFCTAVERGKEPPIVLLSSLRARKCVAVPGDPPARVRLHCFLP